MDLSEALRNNPHTAELTGTDHAALCAAMSVTEHPDGHVFIQEGQQGSTLFLLLNGDVAVSREHSEFSHRLKKLQPGEFFGQLSLINHEPCAATCVGVGATRIAALPEAAFSALFSSHLPVGAGHTSGRAVSNGRLPVLRRTLTTSVVRAPARASSRPLRTVLIAIPVARAAAATPP
jgi:CRP-like cAMP-binding protein